MAVPALQYLVAFQNDANDDPGLITTVATPPGTLGAVNVWTDITRFVLSDSGVRGRQHEFQQFEAGTRILELHNADGRFTPWNSTGPYTTNLLPRRPIQVRANWLGVNYTRYTGQIDSWQVNWPDQTHQTVTLHASDALRQFNGANITSGGYPAQVLADGADGYWRFNDPIGSIVVADYSGRNLTGHLGSGATVTFGQNGALIPDPATSTQLSATATGSLNVLFPSTWTSISAGTIEYWYNSTDSSNTLNPFITQTATLPAWSVPISLALTVNASVGGGFRMDLDSNPVPGATVNTQDGNWHHLACTFTSGASLSGQMATILLYHNGALVFTSTNVAFTPTTPLPNGITTYCTPTCAWLIQECAFYPTALSAAQIAQHFNLAAFPQEGTGARVGRVLNTIGWSAGARAVDTGISTVQAQTTSLAATSSLSHLQQVESTESGALLVNTAGQVQFLARSTLQSSTIYVAAQATFSDNVGSGAIPYQPAPILARDDIDLYNEATAQRQNGLRQISQDLTSIAVYGRNTWTPPASLVGISDTEVLELTQYAIVKYAQPIDRLAAITIDLASVANAFSSTMPSLLSLDLLYQVKIERTAMPGAGTAFTTVLNVEKITETIDAAAGTWTVTFGLTVADPTWWILGTSQLGISTRLAY